MRHPKRIYDFRIPVLAFLAIVVVGCGRSAFTIPTQTQNPPPTVPISAFATVELAPVTYLPAVTKTEDETTVVKVAAKISELVALNADPLIKAWNSDTQRERTYGTLVIQPFIKQLKWVTRGERVWAGAMYGNSAIEVGIRMADKASGNVIHEAMLFARAGGMSGAWGTQEDALLRHISERISNYIVLNYEAAIGGPTGVNAPQGEQQPAEPAAAQPAPAPAEPQPEPAAVQPAPAAAQPQPEPAAAQPAPAAAEPQPEPAPAQPAPSPAAPQPAGSDICGAISCSGHGTCIVKGGEPFCACDTGFKPDHTGINCVANP